MRPESIELTINGSDTVVTESVNSSNSTVSDNGNKWTYVFKNMPAYKADGTAINYSISENTVPNGYKESGSPASNNGTITNSLITNDLTVVKVWDDVENAYGTRQTSLSVTLAGSNGYSQQVTLNDNNKWTSTLEYLPVYTKEGKEVEYTWSEDDLDPNYKLTATEISEDGLTTTLTNTLQVKVDLQAEKISVNNDEATGVDGTYALGDVIKYEIKVTNNGNVPHANITVTDENGTITEDAAYVKSGDHVAEISTIAAGSSVTVYVTHVVTEADILSEEGVVNKVVVTADPIIDPEDPDNPIDPTTEDETEDPTEDPDGHLTITKTTKSEKPENGYELGAKIEYEIKVENDGNLTFTDITVTDELKGIVIENGSGYTANSDGTAYIASLGPNDEPIVIKAYYIVTSDDILAGSVKNTATGTGTNPDPDPDPDPIDPGTTEDPTDDLDTTLSVNKKITNTPADGEAYKLGETIEYSITVTNDGNVPYYNVVIEDDLTGATKTVTELAVGKSESLTTEYVVTSDDILAGSVTNAVVAKGDPIDDPKDPDNPKTPEGEDEVTTGDEDDPDGPTPPIEDLDTTLSINKKVTNTPADGEAFKLGETIEYSITVTNDGNVAYTNVKVEDKKTGFSTTITELGVGKTQTFTTSHVVTAEDIQAGSYTNTVTAAADPIIDPKDPNKPNVPEGEDKITTGDKDDPDGPVPPIGKADSVKLTIHYRIMGETEDWNSFTGVYQVNSEYNVLSPSLEGYAPNISRVTGTITEDTEVFVYYYVHKYGIIIHYRYINGLEAAPDYVARGTYGYKYDIESPEIYGWTADQESVIGIMPAHDVEITVFYTPDYTPGRGGALPEGTPVVVKTITIDEYGAALGLGDISLNVGETIE